MAANLQKFRTTLILVRGLDSLRYVFRRSFQKCAHFHVFCTIFAMGSGIPCAYVRF